jgi:hypothetical protein
MRTRLVICVMSLIVTGTLVFQCSATAFGSQETKQEETPKMMKAPAKRTKRKAAGRRAVPTTVQGCIDRLIEISSADPLISYDGQPRQIINNSLLWSDSRSKCMVSDPAAREKIVDLATAWQMKDAAKVRSLLQDIKSSTPQT